VFAGVLQPWPSAADHWGMESQARHGAPVHEKPNRHILESAVRIALAVGAVLVVLTPALLR